MSQGSDNREVRGNRDNHERRDKSEDDGAKRIRRAVRRALRDHVGAVIRTGLTSAEVAEVAGEYELRSLLLDTSQAPDKAAVLDAAARAVDAPDYFGRNWDALADVLSELSAAGAAGVLLIWQGAGAVSPPVRETLHEILTERAEAPAEGDAPVLLVAIRGD